MDKESTHMCHKYLPLS